MQNMGCFEVAEKNGIPNSNDAEKLLIKDLIQRYIDDPQLAAFRCQQATRPEWVTKKMFQRFPLRICGRTTSSITAGFRASSGAAPSTVAHDLSYLSTVLSSASQSMASNTPITQSFLHALATQHGADRQV